MIETYFITKTPTPLLNTPFFNKVFGNGLPFDNQGLVREIEMIALAGMVFNIIDEKDDHILEVRSSTYCAPQLFVDRRFGYTQTHKPKKFQPILPPANIILERMERCVGLPYVWGGNFGAGIPEWKDYYPPLIPLSDLEKIHYGFYGLDCSGLIYEATDGWLPRNTAEMMKVGITLTLDEVQPLDLFFYPGHVFIMLNEIHVIESNLEYGGVRIIPMIERLKSIEHFTIKRFHPQVIASQKF